MNAEDLLAEAHAMARRCVRLSSIPSGSPPAGRWRGPAAPGVALLGEHLLSFDCRHLPEDIAHARLTGCASLHAGPPKECLKSGFAVVPDIDDFGAYPKAPESTRHSVNPFTGEDMGWRFGWEDLETHCIPLYAYSDTSLPCVDDLFQFGSAALHRWLRSLGWEPEWRYNGNFRKKSELGSAYERMWWAHVYGPPAEITPMWPLTKDRTFAILGGWPVALVDEDHPPGRLVLTTFAEAEPLRQVWLSDEGFVVVDQTT